MLIGLIGINSRNSTLILDFSKQLVHEKNLTINEAIANIPLNYRMIWKKDHFANSLIAKKAPLNYYEDIPMLKLDS